MALSGLATGCSNGGAETRAIALRLGTTEMCAVPNDVQLTVVAEGHYPASERAFALVLGQERQTELPAFDGDTLAYRVEARGDDFEGAGRVTLREQDTLSALVLPLSRVCEVVPRATTSFAGGRVAPLGGADLLWVGDGSASQVIESAQASTRAPSDDLFVPRWACSATPSTPGLVVVAGGRQSEDTDGAALANYEVFDAESGAFVDVGRLARARAGHAAVRAADGSVWLAGGRDEGLVLASVEKIDAGEVASLARASDQVRLLAMDDGSVVALDFSESRGPSVQRFDVNGEDRVDEGELPIDTLAPLTVALPGQRIASFEVDADERTTGRVCLHFDTPGDACIENFLTPFAGLADARALALRDGRVLLTGALGDAPALRIVDVGRRTVAVRRLDFVPERLTALDDGSIALLGAREMALLREESLSTTVELSATLLAPDAPLLVLDSVDRWRWRGLTLEALEAGARVHIAAARFMDMDAALNGQGNFDLDLDWTTGERLRVSVKNASVEMSGLRIERSEGAPVRLERRGETFTIRAGEASRSRSVPGLVGEARLSLRATKAGATLNELRVERR